MCCTMKTGAEVDRHIVGDGTTTTCGAQLRALDRVGGGCRRISGCATVIPPVASYPPLAALPAAPATMHFGHITTASWYGPGSDGRRTSSGETFHQNELAAASRTLPTGSRVRVTNLRNGRSVVVRINDRGPFVSGRGIDLSRRAAEHIGIIHRGVARVRIASVNEHSLASRAVQHHTMPYERPYQHRPRRRRLRRVAYRYRRARTLSNPVVS
jgi:rare lipoprotein A (peptidoglycan hydrolase)